MKKRVNVMVAAMMTLAAVLVAGCASTKLSEDFDEAEVTEKAQEIVNDMATGQYDAIVEMMSAEMKEAVPAEVLQQNMDAASVKAGAFVELKSTAAVGQKDKSGEDYAAAVVVAKFENANMTFTISFNKAMEVIGFYMR